MGMIIEENIMVPMRDGVRLAVDIYRPAEEGRWPVLVTRVPYNKDLRFPFNPELRVFLNLNLSMERVVEAGYVIVAQDTRGRYASEGEFTPFKHEVSDGTDTITWAASQPWSNGKVGMYGVSYQGITQWHAAWGQAEALQAIAPFQCPMGFFPYRGGAFELTTFLEWVLSQGAAGEVQRRIAQGRPMTEDDQAILQAADNLDPWLNRLPLVNMPELREIAPYYFEWLMHPIRDEYWHTYTLPEAYEHVTVPVLTVAGWYDFFLSDDLAQYQGMKQRGGSELARQQSRLIIGPWSHGMFFVPFSERSYGGMEEFNLTAIQLRWYDHWLKGIENGVEQDKPVRVFVMGIDTWRDEDSWPLPDTHYRPYYLHSVGHANSAAGDGSLSLDPPGEEPEDVYCYDPLNPVPTVGGAMLMDERCGPRDQREVEAREDVLCYTTLPLEQPVEVTGPVELVLYVSSSARDTDFTGKLVDVYPDGRAEILTDGILRARYYASPVKPEILEPGRIYEIHIDMRATSNVFRAGHRIRLEVSSSNFPRFDRNTNTGGVIATEGEVDCVQAINHIHHNQIHASYLILPIIERG